MSNVQKPEIFYRLKTKDGIVSDIRPLDHFMTRLVTACPRRIDVTTWEEEVGTPWPTIEKREYEIVKQRSVLLVDFEER